MTTVMQLITQPVAPPPVQTYADIVNAKFANTSSNYVSLSKRLQDSLNFNKTKAPKFRQSVKNLESRLSQLNSWNDLALCRLGYCKFADLVIDTTMQRELDFDHEVRILDEFDPLRVNPICVYENPDLPGKFICWDSQHTAIALFVVASRLFNQDIDNITVPIAIYASHLKSEMRSTFINLNTVGRLTLDQVDIYYQKVHSYRTDGTVTEDLLKAEAKQCALENAKMFATNKKFGDHNQPGALGTLTEFTKDSYAVEITEYFCKWFYYICKSSRPVAAKESWMMYEFFKDCVADGIIVDEPYIYNVAASLNKAFNGSFDAERLYTRAVSSYKDWWKYNKPNPDGTLLGISYHERDIGLPFLYAQIGKYLNGPVPKIKSYWTFPNYDLF